MQHHDRDIIDRDNFPMRLQCEVKVKTQRNASNTSPCCGSVEIRDNRQFHQKIIRCSMKRHGTRETIPEEERLPFRMQQLEEHIATRARNRRGEQLSDREDIAAIVFEFYSLIDSNRKVPFILPRFKEVLLNYHTASLDSIEQPTECYELEHDSYYEVQSQVYLRSVSKRDSAFSLAVDDAYDQVCTKYVTDA